MQRITKEIFKRTESEIYRYHETLDQIRQMKDDILFSSPEPPDGNGGGRSSVTSDPTSRAATSLMTDPNIREMEIITETIRMSYTRLTDEKKRLIYLKYWNARRKLNFERLAEELHISRITAIRWRDDFVESVAGNLQRELGWM